MLADAATAPTARRDWILEHWPHVVEHAELTRIHWWNTARLHSAIGHVPPAEHEAVHRAQPPAA